MPTTDAPRSIASIVVSIAKPASRAATIHDQVPPTPIQIGQSGERNAFPASHARPARATMEASASATAVTISQGEDEQSEGHHGAAAAQSHRLPFALLPRLDPGEQR